MVFFRRTHFPRSLEFSDYRWDSFRHILNSSAKMYECLGSLFFRTTTVIESRSDAFDKSKLVMTFLTNLGTAKILHCFRLVLEGKTGREMSKSSWLEILKKHRAINSSFNKVYHPFQFITRQIRDFHWKITPHPLSCWSSHFADVITRYYVETQYLSNIF